jgi:hypothetical protein
MTGGGEMTLQDFLRLYAPTALPQATPVQGAPLSALGQTQEPQQPQGFGQQRQGQPGQGQGQQGQQGGSLPFLGQLAQLGATAVAGGGQAQSGQGGLQQVLINAMSNNGANGSSNALANAVGYVPFGTGSFG